MALSMVINESLVARTFGAYTLQLFSGPNSTFWVPALGVGLLIFAFIVNISNNEIIGRTARFTSYLKIAGIVVFAVGGLWAVQFDIDLPELNFTGTDYSFPSYLGAIAISILAYKGFTTITNSGDEVKEPQRNVGRAIVISLLICVAVYFLVAMAVSSSLSIEEIIEARDYSLAEAARPFLGDYGLYFTVGIAILATVSGVIASIFAVSRMTTMLTDMKLIPHSHFGMPGPVQKHMVVYITVIAITLTIFFDLSRIASMGAIFYLVMDMMIHWGVFKHLRKDVNANAVILLSALILDLLVLAGFIWVKSNSDPFIVILSMTVIVLVFVFERWFIKTNVE
jgi:amino acid transporter